MDEDKCETGTIRSPSDLCFVICDIVTINLVELRGKTGVGALASGGSAPSYPSYIIVPRQAEDYEDTISDSNKSVRVVCNLFKGGT